MVRPASFAVMPGGRPEGDGLSGNSELVERRRADRVMADLTLAFALDIDQAQADEEKWPMGRTLAFAILTSAGLWALIAGLGHFIF